RMFGGCAPTCASNNRTLPKDLRQFAGLQEVAEAGFVEDRDAQLLRLRALRRARRFADDDRGRLLRHTARRLAAASRDRFLGGLATEPFERAGDDDRLAFERLRRGRRFDASEVDARGAQFLDHLTVPVDREELVDAVRDRRA